MRPSFSGAALAGAAAGAPGAPPNPETFVLGEGFPPLMRTVTGLVPLSEAAPDFSPAEEFSGEPPVAPGWPSGEMATRAARLPCGTGMAAAGGAGADERAISVEEAPGEPAGRASANSGAAAGSPDWVRWARRGAAPAFKASLGRAGPVGVACIGRAAGCCFVKSG